MMRRAYLLSLLLSAPSAYALDLNDLTFEAGSDPSGYTIKGSPLTKTQVTDLPADTLQNVYAMLPEGVEVNPTFIDEIKATSIGIDGDGIGPNDTVTATVTFLNEGAGYRNTLGYFIFDTETPPQTKEDVAAHVVIFPNTSKAPDGDLAEGDTMDLNINLQPGQSLGFFVIPNGWGWGNGSYNNITSFGSWNTPFYSLINLNPEDTSENRHHNVIFLDVENEFLVVGFEDLYRPHGDNDFNDLLFTVKLNHFAAIDGVDEEGNVDAKYEILTDENSTDVTIKSIYPSANSWATLAFEDRWPSQGDYDFNDVVLQYRLTETMNGKREIKSIEGDFDVKAMGGSYNNGFAIRIPSVDPANVASFTLSKNGKEVEASIDPAATELIVELSGNIKDDLESIGAINESCVFFRTQSSCLASQTQKLNYSFTVELTNPKSKDDIGSAPYDPFIFAAPNTYHGDEFGTQPGKTWETHLKQFTGTSRMNLDFFNTYNDKSTASNFFITASNFPWALNLSYPWVHPLENVDISHAYPQFSTWVTSSGESNKQWYTTDNADSSKTAQE